MRIVTLLLAAGLASPAFASPADVRGPEGDRGFRNVYPVSASADETDRLYHADLKALTREEGRLAAGDGGSLTDDHRAYVQTRRALIERRYAEATGRASS